MTRDPRAEWFSWLQVPDKVHHAAAYLKGSNDRLAALLPQLEAADALADTLNNLSEFVEFGEQDRHVIALVDAYLAARDAHLTEGTPA